MDISTRDTPLSAIQRRLDELLAGRLLGWTDAEQEEYLVLCNAESGLLRAGVTAHRS